MKIYALLAMTVLTVATTACGKVAFRAEQPRTNAFASVDIQAEGQHLGEPATVMTDSPNCPSVHMPAIRPTYVPNAAALSDAEILQQIIDNASELQEAAKREIQRLSGIQACAGSLMALNGIVTHMQQLLSLLTNPEQAGEAVRAARAQSPM